MNENDLNPVERDLLAHAAVGKTCNLSQRPDDERLIRAAVIYELCTGGHWPVHAKGVRLSGATINEPLDFEHATLRAPLTLRHCQLRGALDLTSAVVPALDLSNSELSHALQMRRAKVDGILQLGGAKLMGSDNGDALLADGLQAGSDVFLRYNFEAAGAVRLLGASIKGDLDLSGATITTAKHSSSLSADAVQVGGNAYLRHGFNAGGIVRLPGARIEGQLSFVGARKLEHLMLEAATCGQFSDQEESWPSEHELGLRGFRFDTLLDETEWRQRLVWARRQGFVNWSPEPYEQLAIYYSSAGDDRAARRMRIAGQDDELTHLRVTNGYRSLWRRFWRRLLGLSVGYGYRRWPAGVLLVVILLAAGGLFRLAEQNGEMVPNEPGVDDTGRALSCGEAYSCFNSWVYGMDVVLPIIDFGQDDAWRPIETSRGDQWWIWARWTFIVIGWTLASVFVASFTALIQHD